MTSSNNITVDVEGVPLRGITVPFLCAPFDAYAPEKLLEHFRSRTSVGYFPVVEENETHEAKINAILENRFEFNCEAHVLPRPVPWLVNPSTDVEWYILLHKFYYAVGLGLRFHETGDEKYLNKWIELTNSWIAETPPGVIATDVTGRRIQNWIYAHYYFVTICKAQQIPAEFYRRFLASLNAQVDYLCAHLAPARNHRTLELYAIFLAGVVFPEMRDASTWLQFSLNEIAKNVASDLLPDGVQSELSTDYHHIVLRNFLCVRRLAKLNRIPIPREMDRALVKALEFSLHAHRPDGVVPAFSDGDARDFRTLLQWGHELYDREDFAYAASYGARGKPPSSRSAAFVDSGYYIVRSGWGEREPFQDERYLMFDCGSLGAGNHGHFDLLSFEAYGYGKPLIVDPGRYTYNEVGETNWRAHFRGTSAHNTVLIDGRNQTRYTPGKRKLKVSGPPPRHEMRAFVTAEDCDILHGIAESCEYPVRHERLIASAWGEYWIVSDLLTGDGDHRYDLLFHLANHAHGSASLCREAATWLVETPNLDLLILPGSAADVSLERGYVSTRYGEKHAAPVMRATSHGDRAVYHSVLYPHRNMAPALAMRRLQVWSDCGTSADNRTQALEISIADNGQTTTDVWFFSTFAPPSGRWNFGRYTFDGAYLLLRENANGDLLRHFSEKGRVLEKTCIVRTDLGERAL